MGATRALITVRRGTDTIYINDRILADGYIQKLCEMTQPDAGLGQELVQPFLDKVQCVARELGDQVAVSSTTGIECRSGSAAYRLSRKMKPKLAPQIRQNCRASGKAKHDFGDLVNHTVSSGAESTGVDEPCGDGETMFPLLYDIGDVQLDIGFQTWEPPRPSKVDFACSAIANEIHRETQLTRPSASLRAEMEKEATDHKTRYPSGALPFELRSFSNYMDKKMRTLSAEQTQLSRCCFCGTIDKGENDEEAIARASDKEVEEQFEDKDDCNTYDCSRFLGPCGICGRGPNSHGFISGSPSQIEAVYK